MFVIERCQAQLFRSALRRCFNGSVARADQIPVLLRHTKNGWLLHARQEDFALLYAQPGPAGKGVFAFPASVLGQFEARTGDPVELSLLRPDLAAATWSERGQTQRIEFPLLDSGEVPVPPELPQQFTPMSPNFLTALHEATLSTAKEPTKYVMHRIQLRGSKGQVIGSDTRQLLVQGGFEFPFTEDLLVPRLGIFGLQPFQSMDDAQIGRTDDHLCIRLGSWMIALTIDKEGRFPDCTTLLRRPKPATVLRLHPKDAEAFLTALGNRLRYAQTQEMAVTLDLGQSSVIRFQLDKHVLEVPLVDSEVSGKDLCVVLTLEHFLRLLKLKFQVFEWQDADKAMLARDGERTFLAMPLSNAQSLPPTAVTAERMADMPVASETDVNDLAPVPFVRSADAPLPVIHVPEFQRSSAFDLLVEAEGLRDAVVRAADHAGRLLGFLRTLCRQPQVGQLLRRSLQSLADHSSSHPENHS